MLLQSRPSFPKTNSITPAAPPPLGSEDIFSPHARAAIVSTSAAPPASKYIVVGEDGRLGDMPGTAPAGATIDGDPPATAANGALEETPKYAATLFAQLPVESPEYIAPTCSMVIVGEYPAVLCPEAIRLI